MELSSAIIESARLFTAMAEQKNILLNYTLPDHPVYIAFDPLAMNRILNNLIDNAIKYNNEQGKILINLTATSDKVILSVSDTGHGMSGKTLQHIFKPYYQLSQKKKNIQGIGIGLSIVKKILDMAGISITVKSEVNAGTCFTIVFKRYFLKKHDTVASATNTIPLWAEPSITPIPEDVISNPTNPSVLIVEDNRDLLAGI